MRKNRKYSNRHLLKDMIDFFDRKYCFDSLVIFMGGKAYMNEDTLRWWGDGCYEDVAVWADELNCYCIPNQDPSYYVQYVGDVATLIFDGSDFYDYMNYGDEIDNWRTYEQWNELLNKHNCFGELGYGWSMGIYRD